MDPNNRLNQINQLSYQQSFQHPPGFYNQKRSQQTHNKNTIAFSKQPQFYSEERSLKRNSQFLDPNRNTNSSFKVDGIPNLYKTNPESILEHLDLDNFKVKPCPINYTHNHKHCPYYHNSKDRKRMGNFYISELCEFCDNCPNGDKCGKSHNRVEQLYRPEKYKTKFCTFYPANLDKCDYGIYCSFAHSESDIMVDLIHNYEYDKDFFMFIFKTVWCPFNLIQHDRGLCVYAHNYQDFRRKPSLCSYEPTPCPNWKTSEFLVNYEDACPHQYNCDKSHGWKESEFHPLNYKIRACPNGTNCQKTLDCPFYHNSQDQRLVGQQIHCKIFRYHAKNRFVTNTFKLTNDPMKLQRKTDQEERRNSFTNLQILNQDFERNLNLYQQNYSVPIIKHKSSTNIPLRQHEDEKTPSFAMNKHEFIPQNSLQTQYNNMLWGNQPNQFNAGPSSKSQTMSPNLNYAELKSKPKNFNTTKNYPQLQMLAAPFQMPQTTIAPNNNLNQSTGINFMNNSFNNQNHFQIVSNQTYPENNNNNNDSFSKQENESFQSGRNTENFKSRKKSNNDLDSGKLDSSEIKENDRLRKIVMMENSEEKIENKHEEDESDNHNENILREICEEDQK